MSTKRDSFLNKITGVKVRVVGYIGAIIATLLAIGNRHGFEIAILVLIALSAALELKQIQSLFDKLLHNFADVPAWPRFVFLGIAMLLAGVVGGGSAAAVLVFLLTAMDGNFFTSLY